MADKTFLDDVGQIDLELDVPFNEFEDEFPQDTQEEIEKLPMQSIKTVNSTGSAEILTKSCVVDKDTSGLSNEGLLIKLGQGTKHEESTNDDDVEEGEVLSQEEEMQLLMDTMKDDTKDNVEDGQNISCVHQNRGNLKRKVDRNDSALDEEADMDVDENLLLESDEDSMLQEKKFKKEEDGEG